MSLYRKGDRVRSVLNDDAGGDPRIGVVLGTAPVPAGCADIDGTWYLVRWDTPWGPTDGYNAQRDLARVR